MKLTSSAVRESGNPISPRHADLLRDVDLRGSKTRTRKFASKGRKGPSRKETRQEEQRAKARVESSRAGNVCANTPSSQKYPLLSHANETCIGVISRRCTYPQLDESSELRVTFRMNPRECKQTRGPRTPYHLRRGGVAIDNSLDRCAPNKQQQA